MSIKEVWLEMEEKIYSTGEDFEQESKVLFELFDVDNDGFISRAEGIAGLSDLEDFNEDLEYEDICTMMKPKSDDSLNYAAFYAFWLSQKKLGPYNI
jgi:Ca2+-binding EF-hand superfamily protein